MGVQGSGSRVFPTHLGQIAGAAVGAAAHIAVLVHAAGAKGTQGPALARVVPRRVLGAHAAVGAEQPACDKDVSVQILGFRVRP